MEATELSNRAAALEWVADQGFRLLKNGERATEALAGAEADMVRTREVFEDRLIELFDDTDKQIAAAENRLIETRDRLAQLMQHLDELR